MNQTQLPFNIQLGDTIYVIETEERTGLDTQVFENMVIGYTNETILYRNKPYMPFYETKLSDYQTEWFLNKEEAEEYLEEQIKKRIK